jgi:hypothetical protein
MANRWIFKRTRTGSAWLPSPRLMEDGYLIVRRQNKKKRFGPDKDYGFFVVENMQVVGEYANRYEVSIGNHVCFVKNRAEGRKVMREMRPEDEAAIRRVETQINTLGEQLQAMKDEAFRNGRTIPLADLEALVIDRDATRTDEAGLVWTLEQIMAIRR